MSRLIKDQFLDDESIKWLTDQWSHSVHLVNRLLKDPVPNNRITEWARTRYRNAGIPIKSCQLLASQSVPSWNHIGAWLKGLETFRQTAT